MSEQPCHAGTFSSSSNFFPYASGTTVNGGAFIGTYVAAPDDSNKHLEPLYKLVSQNAILNQGGRADEVRCYPGTREEVIARIEKWRDGGHLLDKLIFWLSGPAGAGKSAIMQTVAERCIMDGIFMINFFFFRADGTRNHIRSLVPTLLFQLFNIFPSLKALTTMIIRENPVIFGASLANQFRTLVIDSIIHLQQASPSAQPVLLLIDGLDECDSRADQSSLLRVLHDLANLPSSPFISLVASRAESQIVMTFNSISTFHGSIFLDDSYRPHDDIRLYVRAKLTDIRKTHTLRLSLGPEWPFEEDINSIVRKSSGQFIYAATVARFVANPFQNPHASLQTVLGIRPPRKRTPFTEIDTLYTHVLTQVDEWDLVRDIIFLAGEGLIGGRQPLHRLMEVINYNIEDIESALIVLAPIIRLNTASDIRYLDFYHASFNDFLHDRTRAGNFFLDEEAIATQLLQKLIGPRSITIRLFYVFEHLLDTLKTPTADLTSTLQQITLVKAPSSLYLLVMHQRASNRILDKISRIYKPDISSGKGILRIWVAWFHEMGMPRSDLSEWYSEFWPAMPLQPENSGSPALGPTDATTSSGRRRFRVRFWKKDKQ